MNIKRIENKMDELKEMYQIKVSPEQSYKSSYLYGKEWRRKKNKRKK